MGSASASRSKCRRSRIAVSRANRTWTTPTATTRPLGAAAPRVDAGTAARPRRCAGPTGGGGTGAPACPARGGARLGRCCVSARRGTCTATRRTRGAARGCPRRSAGPFAPSLPRRRPSWRAARRRGRGTGVARGRAGVGRCTRGCRTVPPAATASRTVSRPGRTAAVPRARPTRPAPPAALRRVAPGRARAAAPQPARAAPGAAFVGAAPATAGPAARPTTATGRPALRTAAWTPSAPPDRTGHWSGVGSLVQGPLGTGPCRGILPFPQAQAMGIP